MFRNYLNVAIRSLLKHKGYSAINVLGLSIGIACCLMIVLFIRDELSYDRYHEKADQIYRVTLHGVIAGQAIDATTTSAPMAHTLMSDFPEVEIATRVRQFYRERLVKNGDQQFQEKRIFLADSTFFQVFTAPMIAGDPATALNEPMTVVLTEDMADKYFGAADPLGRTLKFSGDDYRVTGITKNVPSNSHFHYDFLASFATVDDSRSPIWISNNIQTYLVLQKGAQPDQLVAKFPDMIRKYVGPQVQQAMGITIDEFLASGGKYDFALQPLTDIHLTSHYEGEIEPNGNMSYVYIFSAVAFFILLLACINFMNLATARSANRAKEIGVRKVMGAYRSQLLGQFLCESTLLSFVALGTALVLVFSMLPSFNVMAEKSISMDVLWGGTAIVALLGFALFVGILSGSYPALYLSSFMPQEVLKGKLSAGTSGAWLRSGLVVFQFAISIALISGTLIVYDQLSFMQNKPLGFEKEQVAVIHRASALGEQREAFQERIAQHAGVVSSASTRHIPGGSVDNNGFMLEGAGNDLFLLATLSVGYNFIETMGIELLQGRSFSKEFGADEAGYVVNEAAVAKLGLSNPTESRLIEPDPGGSQIIGNIVGVVKDFHYASLHEDIKPMVFRLRSDARYIAVRIRPESIQTTLSEVEETWQSITGSEPFQYTFLDEDFDNLIRSDRKLGEIFSVFSGLAVVIACLGLYGLASFTAEQRRKEIGVRKVLGASISTIVLLLSREFVVLVGLALLVATPVAYLGMQQWLEDFYYRTDIGMGAFLMSGGMAMLIAFLTVGYQSFRAATINPTRSLRDE
ncbi:MAG: FtsX-like permease family protein [Candidatus Latescibacteria bacterium]|nr:FtsX-like permease family protein [Candidatus Latescibacterota bacterium]